MRKFLWPTEPLGSTRSFSASCQRSRRLPIKRTIHSPQAALSPLSDLPASAVRQPEPSAKPTRRTLADCTRKSALIYEVPIPPQLRKIPTRCIVSPTTVTLSASACSRATLALLSQGSRTSPPVSEASQPPQRKRQTRLAT